MQNKYYAADAIAVSHTDQKVTCKEVSAKTFDVHYDVLAIATGSSGRCSHNARHCRPLHRMLTLLNQISVLSSYRAFSSMFSWSVSFCFGTHLTVA